MANEARWTDAVFASPCHAYDASSIVRSTHLNSVLVLEEERQTLPITLQMFEGYEFGEQEPCGVRRFSGAYTYDSTRAVSRFTIATSPPLRPHVHGLNFNKPGSCHK